MKLLFINETALKSVLLRCKTEVARVSNTRRTRIRLAALHAIEAQRHTLNVGTE